VDSVIDHGKRNVLGVLVDALDYAAAEKRILAAARDGRPFAASALAVHGVMTGVGDPEHRHRLNALDLVTPDGQPVRWALNWLHGTDLRDRVYGPELTRRLLNAAAKEQVPVYFYGSTSAVLAALTAKVRERFSDLRVAGAEPSKFRRLDRAELEAIAGRIRRSQARIVFVGLGCPRQEVFAYELRNALAIPVVAVGAAFDYYAGRMAEPPGWMQDRGLQWAYRLAQDPRRLWQRYLILGPSFLTRLLAQKLGFWRPDPQHTRRPTEIVGYG
jgi:N-acetylglucosaminyldiphosphoundecaprenol N-acetyl-beta-D-mannosaminyltransferase